MCGILGYISRVKLPIENGLSSMHHRGPDTKGVYEYNNFCVGHNRLSIIDLEVGSNQPFHIDHHTLVFNGELYNYLELKEILISEGHTFKTKGDTEVLLMWLIQKGIDGVKDLDGMFAFAWLNEKEGELTICRDSLGIKPVYIFQDDTGFVFSSEINPIFSLLPDAKVIDKDLIAEYLLNGFIYEPETGFKNIRKLQPGSYEIYDLEGGLKCKEIYWSLSKIEKKKTKVEEVFTEIRRSVKKHLVADVPVGLFFSGGIDSSILLTQIKSKIIPVTVKAREEEYKEAGMTSDYSYALDIGKYLNIDIDSIELLPKDSTPDDFLRLVEEVALGNEELMSDFTFQSSKLLSQNVREKGFVVMLSGMGADEIFAGYPRYRLVKYDYLFSLIRPLVPLFKKNRTLSKKIERFDNYFKEKSFGMSYSSLLGYFSRKEVEGLLGANIDGLQKFEQKIGQILQPVKECSNLRKAMYLDFYGFLSHNFLVSDKSSMQASIELRLPLATKKLYELSWGLNDRKLIDLSKLKKPLRSFLLNFIPKNLIDRKKAGFNPPLDAHIRSLGAEKTMQILEENGLFSLLDDSIVKDIIQKHYMTKTNNTYKIYQLLHLSYWYRNFL